MSDYHRTAVQHHVFMSTKQKKDKNWFKKIVYSQIGALADCHLIFKVDGTGERVILLLSPTLSSRPLFSLHSRVPDRISLGNLILTFRTRTWLCRLFLFVLPLHRPLRLFLFCPFSFSPSISFALSLSIFFLILFAYKVAYNAYKSSIIMQQFKMSARNFFKPNNHFFLC